MNNTIKYKYAKDHNQKIVEISTINKHDRNNSQYYCISCGKELIARLGENNQHHFAHKSSADNISCNNETYLHNLAKIKIKEKFDHNNTLIIKFNKNIICSSVNTCKFSLGTKTCCNIQEKVVNLKSYYNAYTTEKQIENFRADILLENNIRSIKPLLIEICVTHPCSEEKINSKLPIIEIPINSEDDIKDIEKNTELKGKIYNITLKDAYRPLEIVYPIQKYTLFSSGKCNEQSLYKTTCKNITTLQHKQALLEISVFNQIFGINFFLFYAQSLGYNIKDCSICQHYKYIQGYLNYPLCMRYKKDNTPKKPHFLYAYRCPYYTLNRKLYQEYKNSVIESHIKIIKNDTESFNKLNHESLYLQHVDKILKESIETLTRYFKKQKLSIHIENKNINLAKYYNSSECSKENELVYCLKLYHSQQTLRPPLFIYCIEENYNYEPPKTSTKAIYIKVNGTVFSHENEINLYQCETCFFHNIRLKASTKANVEQRDIVLSTYLESNNEELHFPNNYKENILSLLEKEFTLKTIFIEDYDHKRLNLKTLFNRCIISEVNGVKMLELYNDNDKPYSSVYIQPCFNNEDPQKQIPTIVLRLDTKEKWKEITYQDCPLIVQGKNGEFYKIMNLFTD